MTPVFCISETASSKIRGSSRLRVKHITEEVGTVTFCGFEATKAVEDGPRIWQELPICEKCTRSLAKRGGVIENGEIRLASV